MKNKQKPDPDDERQKQIERLKIECAAFEANGEFDTAHHQVLANLLRAEPQKVEADNG